MFFRKVIKAFNKAKVKYVVAGGVAVYLHGIARNTIDLDLIVDMSPKNIDKLFASMKEIGFTPKVPVTAEQFKVERNRKQWIKEKNMKVFSFVNLNDPMQIVDIFVIEPITYQQAKRILKREEDISVPIISIDQLIKLKQISGRDQDLLDIYDLERIKKLKNAKKN